ncbi:hypothetical protein RclHR1_00590016 [Rhizophagus clarus]|uniref:F-box domain-containing protein n=1 Tax=Rhizophagus clarus TaxID=94130 RepID=A0A2Z6S6K9_9GLOM|nr:hypothetical protein RclHR1_00590016 [Rhizophagus clarus]GES92475.1 hypothetical protein GLOIN_2v1764020 [Rhizophagus clarus]
MSKLNKDVLSLIFEELTFDKNRFYSNLTRIEKRSLYSCLFVNRLWCEVAIPILWDNPWKFVIHNGLLLNVMILFLSKESQEFLKSQGIYIISAKHDKRPLFDYISYCKYINFRKIENFINNGRSFGFNEEYQNHAMKQEIYKLLINKSTKIKCLDMMNIGPNITHQIYNFNGAKNSLGELTFLSCDSSIDSTFYYGLSYICKLIQKIDIKRCLDDNLGLARLIEVQKNLKCFVCSVYDDRVENNIKYENIGKALIKQAKSLIHLKLIYDDDFFLLSEILPKLINLKKLKLINIDNNDYQLEKYLEISTFSKLQVLHIEIISSLDIAINMIKKTEGNLMEVLLGSTIYDEMYSGKFIRTIYEYCPNIKVLSLGINDHNNNDYIEFEVLLKKSVQLQKIVIDGSFDQSPSNLLLEKLVNYAPKSLREIRIFNDWEITASDLELFLEKWRGREPIVLYFFMDLQEFGYFNDNLLSILKKYREEGVIKNYRCDDEYQDFYFSW